jgi:hypothetical protein
VAIPPKAKRSGGYKDTSGETETSSGLQSVKRRDKEKRRVSNG